MPFILVAYDGSEVADKALQHSISIAEPEDEILLLYILPESDSDLFSAPSKAASLEDALELLKSVKDKFKYTGLLITTKAIRGNIISEIIKASDDPYCKLVVLGYKGVTQIGRFKLGNVSGEVAKRASKPVLIVK